MTLPDQTAVCEALLDVFDAGVLICDRAGQILMHNAQALTFLGAKPANAPAGSNSNRTMAVDGSSERFDSLFELIDQRLLINAFDEVERKIESGTNAPHVVFVTALRPDRLVRVKVRRVLTSSSPGCFVVHLQPIEQWREVDAARHRLLRQLAEGMRDPLASVRAAIETITEYPNMESAVAAQFKQIILRQAVVLNERLEEALDAYAHFYRSRWPLDEMAGGDLLAMLHARLEDGLDVPVPVDAVPAVEGVAEQRLVRVRVDAHALSEAVTFLARRIINAAQCDQLILELKPIRHFVALDLMWEGNAVSQERLDKWGTETLNLGNTIISMTLREIVDHHDAEVWIQDEGSIRLMLPA